MAKYTFTVVVETDLPKPTDKEMNAITDQLCWGLDCMSEYDNDDNEDGETWPVLTNLTVKGRKNRG